MNHKNLSSFDSFPISLWRRLPTINLRTWLPSRSNILFTVLVVFCLIGTSRVWAAPQSIFAQAATSTGSIAYQGRLADASGAPLTGTYIIVFRLYNVASGGSPLWEESWTGVNSVQVNGGLFNVMLGSLTPIPQSLINGNSSLWLGIDVGTDAEMTPRVQLGSVPYAIQSQHAERANGLTAPDGSPADAVIVDNDGKVGIGTANPTAKLQIGGQGGLLQLLNDDPATVSTSEVDFSLGQTNKTGGNMNNWLQLRSFGDGYAGMLTSNLGGASLPLDRADVIHTDGESMIFANYLNKPFYFMQGVGGWAGPAVIPLTIAANGNIGIGTTNPNNPLEMGSGAYVSSGGVWTNNSDRNLKENFTAVDGWPLLEKIASLPISEWNYKTENSNVKHIGPMAQDFYAAFNLGEDDKHISTVDASGVALAAIQSLHQRVKEQDSQIALQQQQIAALDERLAALERSGSAPTDAGGWNLVILALAGSLSLVRLIAYQRHNQKKGIQQ